jgi:hypothetical protein
MRFFSLFRELGEDQGPGNALAPFIRPAYAVAYLVPEK